MVPTGLRWRYRQGWIPFWNVHNNKIKRIHSLLFSSFLPSNCLGLSFPLPRAPLPAPLHFLHFSFQPQPSKCPYFPLLCHTGLMRMIWIISHLSQPISKTSHLQPLFSFSNIFIGSEIRLWISSGVILLGIIVTKPTTPQLPSPGCFHLNHQNRLTSNKIQRSRLISSESNFFRVVSGYGRQ